METAYIRNAAGHAISVDIEALEDNVKLVEIDLNEWYAIAEYGVMGYDFNEYIPENIPELTDEELRKEAIETAKKIDTEINENLLGAEWENYHEQIEDELATNGIENVEIIFTGRYELSEKDIWNDSSWVVENWKEEAGIEDD